MILLFECLFMYNPACLVQNNKFLNHWDIVGSARLKRYVFSFFLNSLVSVISLMLKGRLFQALGAATENAHSDETSLDCGTTRSCLPAEQK